MLSLLGLGVLGYTIAVGAYLTVKLARFQRTGNLLDSLVQAAFLPEKRRRYMALLSTECSFLAWAALVWGFTVSGLLPADIGEVVLTVLLVAGLGALAALTELGLRAPRLTEADRAWIRKEAPHILQSLAFMPASVVVPPEEEAGLSH